MGSEKKRGNGNAHPGISDPKWLERGNSFPRTREDRGTKKFLERGGQEGESKQRTLQGGAQRMLATQNPNSSGRHKVQSELKPGRSPIQRGKDTGPLKMRPVPEAGLTQHDTVGCGKASPREGREGKEAWLQARRPAIKRELLGERR